MLVQKQVIFILLAIFMAVVLSLTIGGCGEGKKPAIMEKTMVDSELSGKLHSILEEILNSEIKKDIVFYGEL